MSDETGSGFTLGPAMPAVRGEAIKLPDALRDARLSELDGPSTLRPPVTDLSGLQRAGFRLATIIFSIMSAVVIALFVSNWLYEAPDVAVLKKMADAASQQHLKTGTAESLKSLTDVVKMLTDAQKASREFWTAFGQLLLLNLLLPVLTSILGYIFGTSRPSDK